MKFTKKYFVSQNYTNYLSRGDRYKRLASEFDRLFHSVKMIDCQSKILDYGCAVGFLTKALVDLGYKNTVGYDISQWAVKQAIKNGCSIIKSIKDYHVDLMFALDVFEHMQDENIADVLENTQSKIVIVRIPCAKAGKKFYLAVSQRDETHINCKTKQKWLTFFKKCGYSTHFPLNLYGIYDSTGCFCAIFIKDTQQILE